MLSLIIIFVVLGTLFLVQEFFLNLIEIFYDELEDVLWQENEEGFFNFDLPQDDFFEIVYDMETTFDSIAGNAEAKEELKEMVDFLLNPERYKLLGARLPKGVLLSGPPGTGKTLFARAVAGESQLPFIQVSGSQFVELLVGTGAARVRELFNTAREMDPCIIFIDEIDSIARTRSNNSEMGAINDEREQTLNQLLTEMDGFNPDSEILVIAATNRVDMLDPALIRPGRFDRQIAVTLPSLEDREAILKVHAQGKFFDKSVSFGEVALQTPLFSGADLENLLNEAAILSVRRGKEVITMDEIFSTIDRLIYGVEGQKPGRIKVKQFESIRKVGQALMSIIIDSNITVKKLSLVPRNNSQQEKEVPISDLLYPTRENFLDRIAITLGGLVVEELVNGEGERSVEAEEQIGQATELLQIIVTDYAMSKLQNAPEESNEDEEDEDLDEQTLTNIESFSDAFVRGAYQRIYAFLVPARPILDKLVDELVTKEEMSDTRLRYIIEEYLSYEDKEDILFDYQAAKLFDLIFPGIEKTPIEMTKDSDAIIAQIRDILSSKNSQEV